VSGTSYVLTNAFIQETPASVWVSECNTLDVTRDPAPGITEIYSGEARGEKAAVQRRWGTFGLERPMETVEQQIWRKESRRVLGG
jgi:hypothetical protein